MPKRVLITGSNRGIGLVIAKSLADLGHELVLLTGNNDSSATLKNLEFVRKSNADVYPVDQSNPDEIEAFTKVWSGQLWGIVNNAAICKTFYLQSDDYDPLEEILNTNLIGPYNLTKKLLPYLTRPGRIVNIASQLGREGREGYSAYCASKFGLIGMTKCWAKELGREGITVNAICPGWVNTEMSQTDIQRMAKEEGISERQFYENISEPLELKRFNSPEEVANLVTFLLSDSASGITGRDWLMQTVWNQK